MWRITVIHGAAARKRAGESSLARFARVRKQFDFQTCCAIKRQPEIMRACFQSFSYPPIQQGAPGLYNGRSEGLNSIQLLSDQIQEKSEYMPMDAMLRERSSG